MCFFLLFLLAHAFHHELMTVVVQQHLSNVQSRATKWSHWNLLPPSSLSLSLSLCVCVCVCVCDMWQLAVPMPPTLKPLMSTAINCIRFFHTKTIHRFCSHGSSVLTVHILPCWEHGSGTICFVFFHGSVANKVVPEQGWVSRTWHGFWVCVLFDTPWCMCLLMHHSVSCDCRSSSSKLGVLLGPWAMTGRKTLRTIPQSDA